MKIAYAFRRNIFYPFTGGRGRTQLPEGKTLTRYLGVVKEMGLDGLELGMDSFPTVEIDEASVKETAKRLEDAGLPCVAVRAGGGFDNPSVGTDNRRRLERAIELAGWLGAGVVNTALVTPPKRELEGGSINGTPSPDPSSRSASQEDFERTARVLREVGALAGSAGLDITVEVHQRSIADNSWSKLHLLDAADSPYVHANPDLGNILWNYDEPEESMGQAIAALEPRSRHWHCKNLYRVHGARDRLLLLRPRPTAGRRHRLPLRHRGDGGRRLRLLRGRRGRDRGGPDTPGPQERGVRQGSGGEPAARLIAANARIGQSLSSETVRVDVQ